MLPSEQESNQNKRSAPSVDPSHDIEAGGSSSSNNSVNSSATPRNTAESHKSWSSALLTLLSGSRSNQENSDATKDGEKIDEELTCPICQDIMKEVFATNCGHSFCYQCITVHMDQRADCPLCRSKLSRAEIYPNFQLNRLAEYRSKKLKEASQPKFKDPVERIIKESKGNHLSIAKSLASSLPYDDLVTIFNAAIEERKQVDNNEAKFKNDLLCCFLSKLKKKNKLNVQELIIQNEFISSDLNSLISQEEQQLASPLIPQHRKRKYEEIADEVEAEEEEEDLQSSTSDMCPSLQATISNRMDNRFEDLKEMYYAKMFKDTSNLDKRRKLLDDFSSTVYQLTRYDRYEVLDSLNYTDNRSGSSIVSSIEFDRDEEFFAVGGVTREIKIFDYSMMGLERYSSNIMMHCPVRVMNCGHKISCLSWSPYIKSQIASSDYEGCIDVWDASTGQKTHRFDEHKRRAWSVDICHQNPNILASGSDDSKVKVWSLSESKSIHTLEQKGNVCCAKFAPNNSNYLAVGSADHYVNCYDLRFPTLPVKTYRGHKKAVSYVKWFNDEEIVSASTDSTLKLWDRESTECKRTFTGHQNEKNFVGLSINGDWISCGSEMNTLYTYHKSSRIPVTKYKFPSQNIPSSDDEEVIEDDPPLFVSSVSWKKGTSNIIAANSRGIIKVLQMK